MWVRSSAVSLGYRNACVAAIAWRDVDDVVVDYAGWHPLYSADGSRRQMGSEGCKTVLGGCWLSLKFCCGYLAKLIRKRSISA